MRRLPVQLAGRGTTKRRQQELAKVLDQPTAASDPAAAEATPRCCELGSLVSAIIAKITKQQRHAALAPQRALQLEIADLNRQIADKGKVSNAARPPGCSCASVNKR